MRTGRVRYHQVCIGATDRRARSSQLRSDWRGSGSERLYTFRTYASILAHRRLDAVAAMKMDIEGFGAQRVERRPREPWSPLGSPLEPP